MLEILHAPKPYGDGIMGSATAYRGTFCYIAGFQNAAADVGGVNGAAILRVPYTSAQAFQAKYLVDKLYFNDDYNDTADAVDKIAQGATVRYFDEGEFISNKVGRDSFGITSAYINSINRVSSAAAGAIYSPGINATVLGVASKAFWLFAATGPGQGRGLVGNAAVGMGWLIGTPAASITTNRAKAVLGRVLGISNYGVGNSSVSTSNVCVRFRIENPYPGAF